DVLSNKVLGIHATRIYAILLVVGFTTLMIYSSSTLNTRSVTISNPSLATFERLHSTYPQTLICPCSQLAAPYSKILFISPPRYHPSPSNVQWDTGFEY
ncbi:unnamed protein product, partial [Rotaria sp. Silwood1]